MHTWGTTASLAADRVPDFTRRRDNHIGLRNTELLAALRICEVDEVGQGRACGRVIISIERGERGAQLCVETGRNTRWEAESCDHRAKVVDCFFGIHGIDCRLKGIGRIVYLENVVLER